MWLWLWLWQCDFIQNSQKKRSKKQNHLFYHTNSAPELRNYQNYPKTDHSIAICSIFYSTGPWSDTALPPKLSPHNPSTWQRPRPTRSSGWSSGSPPPWWGCPLTFVIIIIKTNTISIIILWSGSPPPQWNLLSDLYNTYINLLSNMLVLDSTIK